MGFIWFGTNEGLVRFDGYRSKIFKHRIGDANTINSNVIRELFSDSKGRLWVGTDEGLQEFNFDTESFREIAPLITESSNKRFRSITAIIEDNRGTLWVGTKGGLLEYASNNSGVMQLMPSISLHFGFGKGNINSLTVDDVNNLWISTENGITLLKDGAKHTEELAQKLFQKGEKDNNKIPEISKIHFSTFDKRLWVGTSRGLYEFNTKCYRAKRCDGDIIKVLDIPLDGISDISSNIKGDLWIGTNSEGVFIKRKFETKFRNIRHSISNMHSLLSNMITATFLDEFGVFWVGSVHGISKVDLASGGFHRISRTTENRKMIDDFVTSITGDAKGRIYLGTKNNGVIVWDRKSDSFKILKNDEKEHSGRDRNQIRTINIDRKGKIWITTPLGLESYNELQGVFVEHKTGRGEPQIIDTVQSIHDRNGNFWFTSRRGLFKLDPETQKIYQILPIKENGIFDELESTHLVTEDSAGRILFTTDRGVQKIAPSDTTYQINEASYNHIYSHLIGRINAFIEDSNQKFWVTTDLGLFSARRYTKTVEIEFERGVTESRSIEININVNPDKEQRTPTYSSTYNAAFPRIYDEFIPLDTKISAIVQDRKENIWLSTSKGIAKLDPKSNTLQYFPQSIEQQSENFSANVVFVDKSNTLYFAGPNGITYFDPDELFENSTQPRIAIRSFNITDKTPGLSKIQNLAPRDALANEDKAIHVPFNQSSISIEYTALHFANSKGNKYRYKLEGIDEDWIEVDSRKNNVQYSNLNPGQYKFRVMAASAYGIWSNEATIQFVVAKPYWQSFEFGIAAICVLMVLTSFVHNRKVRRHQMERNQLEAQIQERTLEIATQNKNKSKFIADAAHDLRQPIHAIGNLLAATKFALEKNDQEKSLALLQQTKMAATLMSSTFNAILELSRLETGLILPTYTTVDLSQLLSEIINTLSGLGAEKNVSLKLALNRDKAYIVRSDTILLTRILTNLISNAIKYSNPPRARVILRLAIIQNRCRIYVLDNGIGMSEDNLPKIFQPFYQINNPEHDRERGLGLGLSIVSAAISILDGHSIDVCSIAQKGTIFCLELPLTSPTDLKADKLTQFRKSDFPQIAGLYVIYVEDDSLVRTSTEILLRELGVLVSSFKSGEDLFEELKEIERCPDLILTDHNLPNNVTSDEIIFAIRDEFDSPIPAIIISGEYMDENFGMQRSANVLLRKPVSPSELAYCIEKVSKTSVSNLDGAN